MKSIVSIMYLDLVRFRTSTRVMRSNKADSQILRLLDGIIVGDVNLIGSAANDRIKLHVRTMKVI